MSATYKDGTYRAEVLDQGFGEAKTRTPFFYLQIKILTRVAADGSLQECPQYERTYRQYLKNETGFQILLGDLKSLGVQVRGLSQLDPGSQDHVSLVGRTIDMTCTLEEYQGKQTERWGVARCRARLPLEKIRQLDSQFGHLLQDHDTSAKPQAVARPNDSDTPF